MTHKINDISLCMPGFNPTTPGFVVEDHSRSATEVYKIEEKRSDYLEQLKLPTFKVITRIYSITNREHRNFRIKTIILVRKAKAKTRLAGTFAGIPFCLWVPFRSFFSISGSRNYIDGAKRKIGPLTWCEGWERNNIYCAVNVILNHGIKAGNACYESDS